MSDWYNGDDFKDVLLRCFKQEISVHMAQFEVIEIVREDQAKAPDANCVTTPDGGCEGVGCMHDAPEPSAPAVSAHKLLIFVERIEDAIQTKPVSGIVSEVAALRKAAESMIAKAGQDA